jgi:uncharacterized repeat protein (TIGR02543 family)
MILNQPRVVPANSYHSEIGEDGSYSIYRYNFDDLVGSVSDINDVTDMNAALRGIKEPASFTSASDQNEYTYVKVDGRTVFAQKNQDNVLEYMNAPNIAAEDIVEEWFIDDASRGVLIVDRVDLEGAGYNGENHGYAADDGTIHVPNGTDVLDTVVPVASHDGTTSYSEVEYNGDDTKTITIVDSGGGNDTVITLDEDEAIVIRVDNANNVTVADKDNPSKVIVKAPIGSEIESNNGNFDITLPNGNTYTVLPGSTIDSNGRVTRPGGYIGSSSSSSSSPTVSLDTNGGASLGNLSVDQNGRIVRPADPVREGYVFDGWYSDSALTKPFDFSATVTSSITLYAKWTEGTAQPAPGSALSSISDVSPSNWFYADVEYVYTNNLFNGTSATTFGPNMPMTRAMLVTVLFRMHGASAGAYDNPFSDVPADEYYAAAVAWAAANGIVEGVGSGMFAPNADITRQDMAVIFTRYSEYANKQFPVTLQYSEFADDAAIASYAKQAVETLFCGGIVNGKNGNIFDPAGSTTRAEMAAIFHRFIEAVN